MLCQATQRPDAPALVAGQTLSYRQLDGLVWRGAWYLSTQGVAPGQVVALSFADQLTLCIALLSLTRLGATAFSISAATPLLLRRMQAANAGAVFLLSDLPELLGCGIPAIPFSARDVRSGPGKLPTSLFNSEPSAPWLMVTGSGSTGAPKLMPVSHQQARARARLHFSALPLEPEDRVASLSALDFTAPKQRLIEAIAAGASFVVPDTSQRPLAFCRRFDPSVLDITVFHAHQLLEDPQAGTGKNPQLADLKALILSASTVSDSLRAALLAKVSPAVYVRYGSNESGPISIARPEDVLQVSGTVGRPLPGVDVILEDETGRMATMNREGRVKVRSPGMITAYHQDARASGKAFRDGWFYPGDLVRFDNNGQLIHLGRADSLMIMNGVNIYPAEIETVICGHPAVCDAAAMPVRSDRHQDIPVCAVQIAAGMVVSERELGEYCVERLGFRAPKRIVRVERIPRTEQGKLIRAELGQMLAASLGLGQSNS